MLVEWRLQGRNRKFFPIRTTNSIGIIILCIIAMDRTRENSGSRHERGEDRAIAPISRSGRWLQISGAVIRTVTK